MQIAVFCPWCSSVHQTAACGAARQDGRSSEDGRCKKFQDFGSSVCIIRPNQICENWTVVSDDPVVWCVCLSRTCTPQKWLLGSRSCLGEDSWGGQGTFVRWGSQFPFGEWEMLPAVL